jgi:hypothetical protein
MDVEGSRCDRYAGSADAVASRESDHGARECAPPTKRNYNHLVLLEEESGKDIE